MDKKRGMALFVIGVIIFLTQSKLVPFLYSVALIPFHRMGNPADTGGYLNLVSILSLVLPTLASILIISGAVIFYRAHKQGSARTTTFQDKY